jgi:hypothetical protein
LVEQFLAGEGPPSGRVRLVGYFGPSKKKGCCRLYLSLDFCSFIEIPLDCILHHEPVDAANENGPSQVYVDPAIKLDLVQVSTQSMEASFLQGNIASSYLAGAAAYEMGRSATDPHVRPFLCPPAYMTAMACLVTLVEGCLQASGHHTCTCHPHCHLVCVQVPKFPVALTQSTCHTKCNCFVCDI